MKILVLGGTGVISRVLVEQLLVAGHEVTVYNRGRSNSMARTDSPVRVMVGDRLERQAFEDAMTKEQFDVVIDMICFTAEDAKSTLRAFRQRVQQIVVVSSIAAYKRPYRTIPTQESAEELFDDVRFEYSFHKAEMERVLWRAIQEGDQPVTIIRPSLTYGIGGLNIGVLRQNAGIVDRIRKGKPLVMFGDGTNPWNFTFVPDLVKAFVGIVGNSKTFGQAYHVTNDDVHMWEDLYLEFGRVVGKEPRIVHLPTELLYRADPALFGHFFFEKMYAGLFDNSKIQRDVPSYKAEVSLRAGLEMMVDWYERAKLPVDAQKDALEDQLAAMHQQWMEQISTHL